MPEGVHGTPQQTAADQGKVAVKPQLPPPPKLLEEEEPTVVETSYWQSVGEQLLKSVKRELWRQGY